MGLADGVVSSRRTGQTITWKDEDGTVLDLTGTTVTGFIKDRDNGTTKAINGTLTLAGDPTTGVFTWAYGTTDIDTAGRFKVQFIATQGATADRSIPTNWLVHEAFS